MTPYPVSPELAARPCSSCSDGETTPGSHTGETASRLTCVVVRRLKEQLEQAEAELEANRMVVRDSKLAKHREQLLSFHSVEPGLVLMNVPEGHSASAKEVQFIKADQQKIIAQYEQTIQVMSMTAKSQQTQKRQAHIKLLKLREDRASASGMSSSAQTDLETSSLVQELSGVYHRLDEAKQQVAGLQHGQAQLLAKCEAETQSAAMATAEVVTLKQELAGSCEHAQAMAAHLASVQEELEDVIALLKEANFNNANLGWDLDHAHRERSELHSKLSLQIEYLQRDLEVAEREGDAARWSLRDSKEAQVQALRAQSAGFDQTLDDVQTAAAQVHEVAAKLEQQVSSLTAALEDSKQREGLTAHKLTRCQQQLQTEVAAWQVKVYEANSRASGAEASLADAQIRKQDLRDHLSQKQAIEAGLLGDMHDLANQLAAAQAKEQDLAEKLACKHANQQKLQAQVCSLASQLNAALASSHQGTGSHLEQLQMEVLSLTHKLAEQQSKTTQAEAAATLLQISADLSQKGTGSQLEQLQKEVLSLTHKLAEQQSKMAQAEAAATLMQISVDLTQKVCDASPRPASPPITFSPYSPLALASISPCEAAALSSAKSTHVPLSESLGAHALGPHSPLTPVSPAVGLCATALMALSGMSHCSPLVRPSAPTLPCVSPASSALHASAAALRALSSLSLSDGPVLQGAPALRAHSSLSSVGAMPGSPDARRALSPVGRWTAFKTTPSVALVHTPSPPQTEATPASSSPSFTPSQLLSDSAARDLVQHLELVLPDLNPPPPAVQSDALTASTDQTPACSQLLSAAKLSESGQTAASAGLLLTRGTSARLLRSPGPAANSPSPARPDLLSSPVASLAASQPKVPVRQTKKQQAMMDCVAKKLVNAMPGICGAVSPNNAAAHSPEGLSVHRTSLQRKSRMSVSKAGGRTPFGDMTNNMDATPNRSPKPLQDDSKSRAGSRLSTGDRPRPLAATLSSPSPAANRRLSMPTIAGSAQQGQENTPAPIHPARQTILGDDLAGSSRHSSCRVRHSSSMLLFPGFTTRCNVSFATSPLEAGVPEMSPGATGVMVGAIVKEHVTPVSIGTNQADAAVTMGLALGSPVSPPSLTEKTCTDLNTVGMLGGSPANPSSISRNALGSAVQNVAPSGASLSSRTGKLQFAYDSAADSSHSSGQEGSNSGAKAAACSSPAKGSYMPSAADTTGKPKRGRARKAAPAVPLAVKTRSQLAQEKQLHRMQLRSGAMPGQSAIASSCNRSACPARNPAAKRGR